MSEVDPAAIEQLLTDSIDAHMAAKRARYDKNTTIARQALADAYRLRQEAHALDPEHTAPAWETVHLDGPQKGRQFHDELMAFYKQQLGVA